MSMKVPLMITFKFEKKMGMVRFGRHTIDQFEYGERSIQLRVVSA